MHECATQSGTQTTTQQRQSHVEGRSLHPPPTLVITTHRRCRAHQAPDEGDLLRARLDAADAAAASDPKGALALYREILDYKGTADDASATSTDAAAADGGAAGVASAAHAAEGVQRVREEALYRLAKGYADGGEFARVAELLRSASPFFKTIPKVRALQF
jgi:hypothetical protein